MESVKKYFDPRRTDVDAEYEVTWEDGRYTIRVVTKENFEVRAFAHKMIELIGQYIHDADRPMKFRFNVDTEIEMGPKFYLTHMAYFSEKQPITVTNEIGEWEMRI